MKSLLAFAAFFILTLAAHGQQVLVEYHWKDLARDGLPGSGTPLTVDGREVLKLENTNDAPLQVSLLTIKDPKLSPATRVYGLTGELRCEVVQGAGYLEMWSYFPPEKPGLPEVGCFSRTLGETGPMRKISGTSDWREFTLPFDRTGASHPPARLQLNLFLPGRGMVYLTSVRLMEFPNANSLSKAIWPNAWWSDRAVGWVGGLGGALIGCLGSLAAWLAYRGKARGFVTALLQTLTSLGILLGLAGLVAVARHQPYAVWFPLVLGAALLLCLCPFRLREFNRKYEEMELQRMASLDAPGA